MAEFGIASFGFGWIQEGKIYKAVIKSYTEQYSAAYLGKGTNTCWSRIAHVWRKLLSYYTNVY